MKSVSKIYLSWRKGKGYRRHVVGVLKKNATEGVRFEYIKANIAKAQEDGFAPYVDFPDINKVYSENVIDIFGQRLMKAERSDTQKYYEFWELDKKYIDDKFYLLAYTQGLLSTDNFEFLAEFYPKKELCFVSEISSLTKTKLPPDTVKEGDELIWQKESDNKFDEFAVRVYKENIFIGYVKIIHNRVFDYKQMKNKLRITVKSVDQNGLTNRIFIRISF